MKGLIGVTDMEGNQLTNTRDRKGNPRLFYSFQPSYIIPPTMVQSSLGLVYKSVIDKTNYKKLTKTKLRSGSVRSIGEIIAQMPGSK